MKKRSKLDLSPGVKKKKAQASGFEPEVVQRTVPDPKPEPKSDTATTNRVRQASPSKSQSRTRTASSAAHSSRTLFITTAAVITVAALALVVFKRR